MQSVGSSDVRIKNGLRDLALHKYAAVHARAIDMIHADVGDPVPYFLLGVLAGDHQNFPKAVELFGRAAELGPKNPRFHAHYAKLLTQLNRQNEARAAAMTASELVIPDADVADMIGVVLSRTGFHEDAVPLFERAIALDPRPANFHYNLAASLQFSGAFERAEQAYKRALQREPSMHRAWSSLVGLSKQSPDSNYLTELQAAFDAPENGADAYLHLGHAIAKTYEDLGDYPTSLQWLHKAKAAKRADLNYDLSKDLAVFDAVMSMPLGSSHSAQESDETAPAPIFVVGLPRTGTTLVDRILSSHRDVQSAGELNLFAGLIKTATQTPSNLVLDLDTLHAAGSVDLLDVGVKYWEETQDLRRSAPRMTDKMPLNFFYAGLIYKAFPNARIICLRRGAMDSCLSNYRQLFSTGFSYYNYSLDLEDTAKYYKAFDALMAHWRASIPANRFMEIHYEDIVRDQENQTRRLLEFCDLAWDEACLRFHENTAPVSTASSVQVRQPLYSGSIGRWRKYGNAVDNLQAMLGEFGQETEHP